MKIIVSRDISHSHFGSRIGGYDHAMSYVLGFERLGHEVYFMEDLDSKCCVTAKREQVPFEQWEGRRQFEHLTKAYGIWPRAALVCDGGRATHGLPFAEAVRVAEETDVLVNIQGRLRTPELVERVGTRVFVDINPAKTQVYHAEYAIDRGFDRHDHFFTVGLNVGTPACEIPACGLRWHPVMPPVVLDRWPRDHRDNDRFTTISNSGGKNTFNFRGRYSGEKSDQWDRVLGLPARVSRGLEIAIGGDPDGNGAARQFREHGWNLCDARDLKTFEAYRDYIASSRGEFSIANNRYVQFGTGWVSDRSARYLACGKPVVVQSTGQESHLPTTEGFLTFSTADEAAAALERVDTDYPSQCDAARRLAEEFFDSDKVLRRMLELVGA